MQLGLELAAHIYGVCIIRVGICDPLSIYVNVV
jgi:hypothetical protein